MRNINCLSLLLVLCVVLVLSSGCGGDGGDQGYAYENYPSIIVPTGMQHGSSSTWAVSWTGSKTPFAIEWDFGGGADPNTVTTTAINTTSSTSVTMLNGYPSEDGIFVVTVVITDADGNSAVETATYVVGSLDEDNTEPQITTASYDSVAGELSVSFTDAQGGDLTVWYGSEEPAAEVAQTMRCAPGVTGTVVFPLSTYIDDMFTGWQGVTTVYVRDAAGAITQLDVEISATTVAS